MLTIASEDDVDESPSDTEAVSDDEQEIEVTLSRSIPEFAGGHEEYPDDEVDAFATTRTVRFATQEAIRYLVLPQRLLLYANARQTHCRVDRIRKLPRNRRAHLARLGRSLVRRL